MIDMDDCYILGTNFHLHKFKALFGARVEPQGEDEDDADYEARVSAAEGKQKDIESNLYIMPDGTIIAVRQSAVDPFLKDEDVNAVRWGRKSMPEKLLIENADDLYKLLAAVVPLEETVNY